MILSDNTLTILKNFAGINESLLFKPGNVIQTIAPSNTVVAKAVVQDEFPREFAIYELGRFLGALSLFAEKELVFSREDFVTIGKGRQKIKYTFAEPSMIVAAPYKDIQFPDPVATFHVKAEEYSQVIKACNVLQLPNLSFIGDGIKLRIVGENVKDASCDRYELETGDTTEVFKASLNVEHLRMLNLDYEINVTTQGIVHFKNKQVEYWVAASIAE